MQVLCVLSGVAEHERSGRHEGVEGTIAIGAQGSGFSLAQLSDVVWSGDL